MLPKLFSNIILALISLAVFYTLAPFIKEFFSGFSGKKKRKGLSRSEFDDAVKRKIERMSSSGTSNTTPSKKTSTTKRTILDYFKEKKLFASEQEFAKFEKLNSSLQWGDFKEDKIILNNINKKFTINAPESLNISVYIKKSFTKEVLLKLSKNSLNMNEFLNYVGAQVVIDNYDKLNYKLIKNQKDCDFIFAFTLATKSQRLNIIKKYLSKQVIKISLPCDITYTELTGSLSSNYTLLYPVLDIDKGQLEKSFNSLSSEDAKKKYKKMAMTYHPDKWQANLKDAVIDKRLQENFNLVKSVFNNK